MKGIIRYISLCILFCAVGTLGGTNLCKISLIDERSGLTQSHVTQIMQDHHGMLWFATWNGLNRYDGYEFTCFKSAIGAPYDLPCDRIRRIWENDLGHIWCLIDTKLFLFDTQQLLYRPVLDSIESQLGTTLRVRNVSRGSHSTSLIICEDGYLFQVDNRTLHVSKLIAPQDFPQGASKSIKSVKQETDHLWVMCQDGAFVVGASLQYLPHPIYAIKQYRGERWCFLTQGVIGRWDDATQRIDFPSGLQTQASIQYIFQGHDNLMWMGTTKGVYCFNPETRTLMATACREDCAYLMYDHKHRLWGYTKQGRLFRLDDHAETIAWYDCERAPRSGRTPLLLEDGQHNLWFVTANGIIYYYDAMLDRLCKPEYVEREAPIDTRLFMQDVQHNLWTVSELGVYKVEFMNQPATAIPQSQPGVIRAIHVDSHQRYWLSCRDDATLRIYSPRHQLLGYLGPDGRLHQTYTTFASPIYCIAEDHDGNFWLGSKPHGLYRLQPRGEQDFAVTHYQSDSLTSGSLNCNDIYDIEQDASGKLWIATLGGGLNCIADPHQQPLTFLNRDNGFERYPAHDTFAKVRNLHITQQGILLAATTDGLLAVPTQFFKPQDLQFRTHTKDAKRENSLSNNATMSICETARHEIFIGTESGGVNQLLSTDLLADAFDFRHYTVQNGMPSDIVHAVFASDTLVWLTCSNALVSLQPSTGTICSYNSYFWKDLYHYSEATPCCLDSLQWIFGTVRGAYLADLEHLQRSNYVPPISFTHIYVTDSQCPKICHNDTLVLQPEERNITIDFAALDYTDINQVSYAFQMKGSSDTWNDLHKMHSATFLNLDPGTYQFSVRSTNSDGVWVPNTRTLTLIVMPTFWETPWAKLLYALLILMVVATGVYIYLYIYNIQKQRKEILDAYLALLDHKDSHTDDISADPTATPLVPQPQLKQPQLDPQDEAFMNKVIAFVEANLSNCNLSIEDLAEATAISHSGLNRRMKSIIGVTPIDFIKEARIQKARQLIEQGNAPIAEVAYQCGFSDPKYFSRCFKKATGCTPSDYKNQLNNLS